MLWRCRDWRAVSATWINRFRTNDVAGVYCQAEVVAGLHLKAVRLLGVGVAAIVAKNRNQVDSWSLKSVYPIVELGDLGQVAKSVRVGCVECVDRLANDSAAPA